MLPPRTIVTFLCVWMLSAAVGQGADSDEKENVTADMNAMNGTPTIAPTKSTTANIRSSSVDETLQNVESKEDHAHTKDANRYFPSHHHENHWGPFFEEPFNTSLGSLNVSFYQNSLALLNCRVGMLHDKTVMWLRKTSEKVSLLTVGRNTYSVNSRLSVKFQYPNNWRLQIYPIRRDDAGLYMCQVSTHPPRVFTTNITVLPPAIRIVDEIGRAIKDRYYKRGSRIELTCQIAIKFLETLSLSIKKQVTFAQPLTTTVTSTITLTDTEQATTIKSDTLLTTMSALTTPLLATSREDDPGIRHQVVWSKNNAVFTLNESHINTSLHEGWHNSRLLITQADTNDTGNYSCRISNLSAIMQVHVLTGETHAAVHHDLLNSEAKLKTKTTTMCIVVIIILINSYFV